jgi:hypothetical protein
MFISKCKFSKLSFTVFMIVLMSQNCSIRHLHWVDMGILYAKDNLEFLNKIQIIH